MPISENKHITTVGGQALIEGLMMMGPKNTSIAIRKADGEIVVKNKPPMKKGFLTKIPIIRGSVLLIKQMIVGVSALMYSAEFFEIEDETAEPSKFDKFLDRVFGDKLKDVVIIFSVILSLFLSVGLFMILPNIIATLSMLPFDANAKASLTWDLFKINKGTNFGHGVAYNLIEGVIRIAIFFGYIVLAAKISPDIKRVWQYHGAEHKTIHCYENGEELTVENIRKYTPLHPRCGTSFLFTVMIVSILIFSVTGWHSILINILIRLTLVPLVAGVSYELFKAVGKSNNSVINIFKLPGLMFQKFTTAEPDDKMIEVAIVAMENALTENKEDDQW